MNNKIKIGIVMSLIAVGLFVLPSVIAQQPNDYRAFTGTIANLKIESDGSNITANMFVYFLPVYPSASYSMFYDTVRDVKIDVSKPNGIQMSIARGIQQEGYNHGINVTKVLLPDYVMVTP